MMINISYENSDNNDNELLYKKKLIIKKKDNVLRTIELNLILSFYTFNDKRNNKYVM